jgi:hypothetical protein
LPRGPVAVARAGPRAQPSICAGGPASAPPTRPDAPDPPSPQRSGGVNPPSLARLRVRPSWHRPACGPSRSSAIAPLGRGADLTAIPPFATTLQRRPRRTGKSVMKVWLKALRAWGLPSVPRVTRPSLRRPRGPSVRIGAGVSGTRLHADTEGPPPPGRTAGSRPEELRAAARGDAQGPKAANPRGKRKKGATQWKEKIKPGPQGKRVP